MLRAATKRRNRLPAGAARLLLLPLLLAGCGGGEPPATVRAVRPVLLEPVAGSGELGSESAAADSVVTHKIEPQRLLAARDGARWRVAGPFGSSRFDRLRVGVESAAGTSIRAGVLRRGKRDLFCEARGAGPDGTAELVFDLEQEVDPGETGTSITVVAAEGGDAGPRLTSLTLEKRTARAFLPTGRAPGWFEIEGDLRRAVRVAGDSRWRATLDARAVDELAVTAGAPARSRDPGAPCVLAVEVAGPAGSSTHEIDPAASASPWSTTYVPLTGVAGPGGTVEVTFSVRAGDSGTSQADSASPPAAGLALAEPFLVRRTEAPPTVVLITSDTHRADHLGSADSGVRVTTPHLDALAAESFWFENCTSAANVTNPSHVAIFTATPPRDTGVVDNSSPVSELAPTLAEAFQAAGYATFAAVSASQLGPQPSGLGQGFARFAAPRPGEGERFDAIEHLSRWWPEARGLPVFVWLHLFDAHGPYAPPPEFAERYWDGPDPRSPDLPEPAVVLPHWARGVRDLDYLAAMYRAEVSALDERLAAVLDLPRVDSAILAFTADHGEHLGQHDVWFDHRLIYPGTLRVPLILRLPDGPRGERSEVRVENMDLGRTLLDAAGLEDTPFPGRNLVREAREGRTGEVARFAFATYGWSASIETEGWFLVLHLADQTREPLGLRRRRHQVELYDLSEDPGCTRDLVDFEPELARSLRTRLLAWLEAASEEGWNVPSEARDAALSAELAALGYADSARAESAIDWFDEACACAECARFNRR